MSATCRPWGRRCWSFWPALTSLVLLVVLLQLVHMVMLGRLEAREADKVPRLGVGRGLKGRMFNTVLEEMEERVVNAYRLDRSGTYIVLDNFLTSEHVLRGRNLYDVSIASQCSTNQLRHLAELAQRWGGPISVAVFTHDDMFISTVSNILHFHFCNDHIYRHVSFHLVYPISRAPKHLGGLKDLKLECFDLSAFSAPEETPQKHDFSQINLGNNYANTDLAYPGNLLRNLAINYALTPYVFMIDIDMVPSANLRQQFQDLMASSIHSSSSDDNHPHSKSTLINRLQPSNNSAFATAFSAFVVPVFEISDSESVEIPKTKSELLTLWSEGQVRPFYSEVCSKCQKLTDYHKWRGLPAAQGPGAPRGPQDEGAPPRLSVAYSVSRTSFWEPFYIAKTSAVPLYDERFKQYGYNRVSQVCELHVSGFSFHVLDHAFLVHRGLKARGGFHMDKDAENRRNKELFGRFKDELRGKYPQSKKTCD